MPFFGWGFMPGFCGDDSWGYGFNGCLSAFAVGLDTQVNSSLIEPIAEQLGKPADQVTLGDVQRDDDSGKFGKLQYDALFTPEQVLANADVPTQGAGDYTQYVNLVLDKNPDAVMISTDFVSAIKLKAALAGSGYKGLVYDYVTYIPGLLESSPDTAAALEGGYSVSQIPANEDNTPAIQQLTADLQGERLEAALRDPGRLDRLLVDGAAAADARCHRRQGDITPENFRAVAEGGFTSETVEGGVGEVTYPDDHKSLAPCSGLVHVLDGKFESAQPFKC